MSGSTLSKAWRRSIAASPLLHVCRWLLHRGYPNHKAFALLDSADLPKEVDALIRITVKRSKLWANERAEIARELIAHAQDALEAGRTGQEIASTFGDPKRIAKLMRRSMKRKRPLYWRAYRNMKRATGVLILVLIVGYSSLAVRFYMGKPEIKRNFIAELNARNAGYSEDQKAWGVYREVDIEWQRLTLEAWNRAGGEGSEHEQRLFRNAWSSELEELDIGHPDNQEALDLFRGFEPELKRIREAASRPVMGMEYGLNLRAVEVEPGIKQWQVDTDAELQDKPKPLIMMQLPYLSMVQNYSRALLVDVGLAMKEGDPDRAFADVKAMLGMSRQVRSDRILISSLVSNAIVGRTTRALREVLKDDPDAWSRDQLVSLSHELLEIRRAMGLGLEYEAKSFDDILQRMFTDDGRGNGRLTAQGSRFLSGLLVSYDANGEVMPTDPGGILGAASEPLMTLTIGDRKYQSDRYHGMIDTIRQVLRDGPESIGRVSFQEIEGDGWRQGWGGRYSPVDALFPAFSSAVQRVFVTQFQTDADLVMLAVEVYAREYGRYPEALETLVPQYLPAIPEDMMNPGRPLQYRLDESGYIIYSAGSDGDLDDGVEPDPKNVDRTSFSYRYGFAYSYSQSGQPRVVLGSDGQPEMALPRGPDSDWVLIDMRRAGASSSGG